MAEQLKKKVSMDGFTWVNDQEKADWLHTIDQLDERGANFVNTLIHDRAEVKLRLRNFIDPNFYYAASKCYTEPFKENATLAEKKIALQKNIISLSNCIKQMEAEKKRKHSVSLLSLQSTPKKPKKSGQSNLFASSFLNKTQQQSTSANRKATTTIEKVPLSPVDLSKKRQSSPNKVTEPETISSQPDSDLEITHSTISPSPNQTITPSTSHHIPPSATHTTKKPGLQRTNSTLKNLINKARKSSNPFATPTSKQPHERETTTPPKPTESSSPPQIDISSSQQSQQSCHSQPSQHSQQSNISILDLQPEEIIYQHVYANNKKEEVTSKTRASSVNKETLKASYFAIKQSLSAGEDNMALTYRKRLFELKKIMKNKAIDEQGSKYLNALDHNKIKRYYLCKNTSCNFIANNTDEIKNHVQQKHRVTYNKNKVAQVLLMKEEADDLKKIVMRNPK